MKKNKFLRLASVMLMLCLITTCAISGTFAKYTTSGTATDGARVAKFGVVVASTGAFKTEDTFGLTYTKTDANYTLGTNSVVSSVQVVAPGTSGQLAAVEVTGQPEVAVSVKYAGTLTLTDWTVTSDNDYCPIIISVGTTELKIGGTYDHDGDAGTAVKNITNVDELETAVADVIALLSMEYIAPGTDLSSQTFQPNISWEWPFSSSAENDLKDTTLGDNAATGTAPEISLSLTVTITQVQ